MIFENFIPENVAFSITCKECGHIVDGTDSSPIECLVELSEHIENLGHTQFDLEIYDFDLAIVKETIDTVKAFEEIDDSYSISDLHSFLKEKGYDNINIIIINGVKNKILYLEDIIDNEVFLALTEEGEILWDIIRKSKSD